MSIDIGNLESAIQDVCRQLQTSVSPGALAGRLNAAAPALNFRASLTRGGWYRFGGVVDAEGKHVSRDLEAWASAELAAVDEDIDALIEKYADSGLRATHLVGKTHYLVAPIGGGMVDFIQVEIEELQETICHELFDAEGAHANLDELLDPRLHSSRPASPLGLPQYKLRRVTDVADFLQRMRDQKPEPQAIHRFLAAWEQTSAGQASEFANHWVLELQEHLDRYRNTLLYARPVAAVNGSSPPLELPYGAQGVSLQQALQRYDRQAGYPMSWFFNMITTKAVPHAVAAVVIDDAQGGFSYLPERDLAVIKNWLFRPYGF